MNETTKVQSWVSHKLDAKVQRTLQKMANSGDVQKLVVMPDVHLSGNVCNGVVVATESLIYPQCVGGDIGCGYLSVELEVAVDDLFSDELALAEIWTRLRNAVPINKHPGRTAFRSNTQLSADKLAKAASREGRFQLGTLGRGNHFVELQRDQQDVLSILIHSGSRSMGQTISARHLREACVDPVSGLKFLEADSEAGRAFLSDLHWARQYAAANRLQMLGAIETKVLLPLGINLNRTSTIHLDHNHVQQEVHFGKPLWVHRKGAQVLGSNQTSVIPGSMGTTTFLVEGRQNAEALNSCSHGAGRLMSRKEAAQRLSVKSLRQEMARVWYNQRRAKTLLDEAPSAYKDIRKVMKAQKDLVRIIGRREPVLSFKGC
jgi:tRNA-splicing ligase RtcB